MSECQTYGDIIDCKIGPGGHALVYFQEVGGAAFARQSLYSKLTTDDIDIDDIEDDITHTNDDAVIINDASFKVTFHFQSLFSREATLELAMLVCQLVSL